jgi:hypothetical protein
MVAIVPSKKPSYGVKLWIDSADLAHLKKLSERTGLPQTEIMSRIVHSGIEALTKAGYRLNLPLVFNMGSDLAEPSRTSAILLHEDKPPDSPGDPAQRVRNKRPEPHGSH